MTLALLITAVGGAWAGVDPNAVTASEIDATVYAGWTSIDGVLLMESELPGFHKISLEQAKTWADVPATGKVYLIYEMVADGHYKYVKFEDGVCTGSGESEDEERNLIWEDIVYGDKRYFYTTGPVEPDVKVTINDAKTEASFEMPSYDATAEYELVRDMSVQMTAQVGDGTQEQPRYRVKKDGNKFIPADMEMAAVPALFTVNDAIEQKALTQTQDYIVQIYAIDAEGQPTGEAMTFATFTFEPGIYAVKAVAAQGSDYDGETALSNTFKLFQGYEVEIAAGEYATFYKEENLYVEDEDAELYTIASVTDTEAVLSDAITVAPAETPLLVYNKSEQDKTFLLIPTTDKTPDNVTAATQFVGTLEATTIPASATGADNYALNGYAFVWVKTAIEVGANKCWLHIASQPAGARGNTRSITGGNGTTGIDAIENATIDNEGWYDLQGRKLQSAPNRKGIYIHNGKKVIVR